jgi:hypothetical protein
MKPREKFLYEILRAEGLGLVKQINGVLKPERPAYPTWATK